MAVVTDVTIVSDYFHFYIEVSIFSLTPMLKKIGNNGNIGNILCSEWQFLIDGLL